MAAADDGFRSSRSAIVLFAVGGIASSSTLAGWLIGSLALQSFGVAGFPAWPLTALANLLLAIALLLTGRGYAQLRIPLIGFAVAIALMALAEHVLDLPSVFDRLLFAHALGNNSPNPGRPGLLACSLILITAVAAWLLDRQRRHEWPIFLLACILIGLGSMALTLLALQGDLVAQAARLTTTSLPIALATICYGAGVLASIRLWEARTQWARLPIAMALVALLILPAIQLPIQMRVEQLGIMGPVAAQTFATVLHLLVVIGLIGWTIRQLSRDNDAISGMTRALRESEERLRFAIEAHELGVFEWDLVNGRLSWSMGGEQRLGLAPETTIGLETWKRYVDPKELRALQTTIAEAADRKADRFSFHYHLHLPDGTARAVEGSARCFYNRDGRLVRAIGVDLDVTDRDAREAALEAGRTQLQSILETVPDAMVVIDDQGRITEFSTAAEQLFGYTAEAAIHRNISMLIPAITVGGQNSFLAAYRSHGERREIGLSRTWSARTVDGTEIPIELSIGESWIGGKHVFTGFIRDISGRIAAEERMEQLNADYAHIARLNGMGEMAAALAHELNQPLAATGNYLGIAEQILLLTGRETGAIEALDAANTELLRTGEIIRRLRDFVAKRDVEFHVEDLDEIIHDAIALAFVGQVQVRTICDIAQEARTIIVDRVQVQQVLVNVLRNAAQAVRDLPPERRVIRLMAETADRALMRVTIEDSGPGFPAEVLATLHTPFVPSKDRGMGIGLSISRRIVESHGGALMACNAPGGGAIISFTLPVYREESESAA
ncbi:MAG: PAS domain S-box protein [Sphingomonadales bacterium]|nr:PAS domain S-box protein [Sphingomonadales bacterium]